MAWVPQGRPNLLSRLPPSPPPPKCKRHSAAAAPPLKDLIRKPQQCNVRFVSRCDCGMCVASPPPKLNSRPPRDRPRPTATDCPPSLHAWGRDVGSAGHQINMANFALPKTVSGLGRPFFRAIVGSLLRFSDLAVPKITRNPLRVPLTPEDLHELLLNANIKNA